MYRNGHIGDVSEANLCGIRAGEAPTEKDQTEGNRRLWRNGQIGDVPEANLCGIRAGEGPTEKNQMATESCMVIQVMCQKQIYGGFGKMDYLRGKVKQKVTEAGVKV